MTRRIIDWCVKNRALVLLLFAAVALVGGWAVGTVPLDAIPDLSDVQVIILTNWMGRDPQTIEDQITYPISSAMLNVPYVKDVRGYSFFGFSFVYVIFEDAADIYWARSRVLEYLSGVRIPEGVTPTLGPDASGLGWVFLYTVEAGYYCPEHPEIATPEPMECPKDGRTMVRADADLGELRALQDWYLRYQLAAVPGVSEIASVGGQVRQYQVVVDPRALQVYGIPLRKVMMAIQDSNNDVGGRVVELSETEHMVRGRGYVKSTRDLENVVVGVSKSGTPILVRDLGHVELGPDIRRGIAEKNGTGEVVAGIVVMRYGENALRVIDAVKAKIQEIQPGLPAGVVIRPGYDRSGLIRRSVKTLWKQLAEEMAIVALVCILFLWHARSALVSAIVLPMGILMSFIVMRAMGINSNIMSLGGIAIAIGAMVDAAVVLVENLHKHKERGEAGNHWDLVAAASREVGPGLFFSLLIITVSFLPVFALEEQAGRLFKPLAYTKTFAMAASALVAITLIPVCMGLFIRGTIHPESKNPLNRFLIWIYLPVIRGALKHKVASILIAVALLGVSFLPMMRLGSEFMPPINEGDILYMPTTVPGISDEEARRTLQIQDKLLKQFPEVDVVLGKIGRSDTSTDPAPLSMVETHVSLKPEEEWPERIIDKSYLFPFAMRAIGDLRERGLMEELQPPAVQKGWLRAMAEGLLAAEFAGRPGLDEAASTVEGRTNSLANQIMAESFLSGRTLEELSHEHAVMVADQAAREVADYLVEKNWIEAADRAAQHERAGAHFRREVGHALPLERAPIDVESLAQQAADATRPTINTYIREAIVTGKPFRPGLGRRVSDRLARDIVETLVAQHALRPDQAKEAASALAIRIPDDLPLRKTHFDELTKEEMNAHIRIPGMPNWWLMPIETRIGMLTTGMRGVLGMKVYGQNLNALQKFAIEMEAVLQKVPGTMSVAAERPMGGNYVDIDIRRDEAARHGLTVGDVQRVVETAIGGMNLGYTVEGRYRFPINLRYPRELRDDPEKLRRVLVFSPVSGYVPLSQIAGVEVRRGPPMIKSENGLLISNIPVDLEPGLDIGTYVERANRQIDRAVSQGRLQVPPGSSYRWSGQFEFMERVKERLAIIIPITLLIIFLLLYFNMGNIGETVITMVTLPFALIGGVWFMYVLGYNSSIAVVIGFIALAGLASETAVIMHVYLDLSYRRRRREDREMTEAELNEAIEEGAVLRVRPKMMTVMTTIMGLMPIMWAVGAGAGPMKRMAAPMIGGLVTSTIHTLILIPVYYALYKKFEHWRERKRKERGAGEPPVREPAHS
ncbi:MAG: efflux RND transporter permease subunit [Planctomycetes bacterium]|nr:efflux RND transporter permease subunit [Planctomycetota bacterium]